MLHIYIYDISSLRVKLQHTAAFPVSIAMYAYWETSNGRKVNNMLIMTLTIAPSSEMAFVPSVMKFCEMLSQLLIFRTCRFDYALSLHILETVPASLLSCNNYLNFL